MIAVIAETSLYQADNMDDLNSDFPGVSNILEIWFTHYKGPGEIQSLGFSDAQSAEQLLSSAIKEYSRSNGAQADKPRGSGR